MSKHLAGAVILTAGLMASALPASAQEATLLCRFSKFTVTESTGTPGQMRTLREISLKKPRSVLLTVDAEKGSVTSPQAHMQIEEASLSSGQVAAQIRDTSDESWLFGEEVTGKGALIIDIKNRIGSVMAQLKSADTAKLALSSGMCREYRMQALGSEPQTAASLH